MLAHEDSPYLQQHADNPVAWQAWSEEAFESAAAQGKPIFLSIGYSSCHWCHVMAHESFEDESIGALLNEHFVSIKVDKEERPDIDRHFQEAYNRFSGRAGGWPLSIFMTPDKKPFFAATYIPPTPRYNMPGFLELLKLICEKYKNDAKLINESADAFVKNIQSGSLAGGSVDIKKVTEKFVTQCKSSLDKQSGGLGGSPKFPHTSTFLALLDIYKLQKNEEALWMAEVTLKCMAKGGFYDIVDGGFCRYSTDELWLVPHFEKMTYDNALLCELYLMAYLTTGKQIYQEIVVESLDFMIEKMSEGCLFYSASDADSVDEKGHSEEGAYFVYGYKEFEQILGDGGFGKEEIEVAKSYFGVTKIGNFEDANIIRIEENREYQRKNEALKLLKEARKTKAYPFIDKKVITAWNAMMLKTLFLAGVLDKKYKKFAKKQADALLALMRKNGTLKHSGLMGKEPKVEAFLEDYAYLVAAFVEGYCATLDKKYLTLAQELFAEAKVKLFTAEGWHFSTGEFAAPDSADDNSYPSSVAVLAEALAKLSLLCSNHEYEEQASAILDSQSKLLSAHPVYCAKLFSAAMWLKNDAYLVKAKKANLEKVELSLITYPLVLALADESVDGFMVCSKAACMAMFASLEEVVEFFKNLLQLTDKII